MGWGTDFTADVFLNKMTFENKYQVKEKIEEITEELVSDKQSLYMYASANPKDLIPEDWKNESIAFIQIKVDELLQRIEENYRLLVKLELYLETLENEKND